MNCWDIIDYNGGKGPADGNHYWRRYTVPHWLYVGLMLLAIGVGIGLVSLFVCSVYMSDAGWSMFVSYFENPLIVVLNVLPCVLLVFFFWCVSGRAWVAVTVPALLIYVMSAINYYKVRIRNEAFTARDIRLAGEALGILPNYKLEFSGRILLMLVTFAAAVLFAVFLMKGRLGRPWLRLLCAVLIVALCAALYVGVYVPRGWYEKTENDSERIEIDQWAQLDSFVSRGFVYSFLHTLKDAFPRVPEGYSAKEAAAILAAAPEGHIADDKKVSVIALMLESYADLSTIAEVPLAYDLYAPFHALQAESRSGFIVSNTFGGGTTNSERAFLTGYAEQEDYNTRTNSYVWYLRGEGYHTEGIHPGLNWFYNRRNVNEYLGFEDYYFLGDLEGLDRPDVTFFPAVRALYDARDRSVPYFSYSISFQNHGAYDATSTVDEAYIERGGMTDASYNILNNYLAGIAETTELLADFVDGFRDEPDPVVIVVYGDHMPWLGDGDSVIADLGINADRSTEEGFLHYYSTPYLIWANDAAKRVTGNDFTGDGGRISACFLMNELFTLCSWDGPAFMAVADGVREHVSVIQTADGWYAEDGRYVRALSEDAAARFRAYDYAAYYSKRHFAY